MLERKQLKDRTQVTFALPADTPPGPVSVVGDFNDWQPGTHMLVPRKDGFRAVTVACTPDQTLSAEGRSTMTEQQLKRS
ncbi:hypothetical protein [Streptomyces xanthophaeus]